MFQSFFTGLSGMFNFSKSLDNVSNNVANMNTPGYRGTDTFLRSLNGGNGEGYGTQLAGTSTRLTPGEIRQTGNDTDVAIVGDGMFVLRDNNGDIFYSRAGQFRFNEDNVLIDAATEYEVMGITESGNLVQIDITENRIIPPVATTEVTFSGILMASELTHGINSISVIDATGETHNLNMIMTNPDTSNDTWEIEIQDENGNTLGEGELRFNPVDSTPLEDFNEFTITFDFNGVSQDINFNFGEPGSITGARQYSSVAGSDLAVNEIDGNTVLGITQIQFDEDGILQFKYSNGDEREGQQLALASFSDAAKLTQTSGSMYRANEFNIATYGQANNGGLGKVQGGSIELSNIDLSQEFADLLIIQRGYQASSRVMSVANELIEQIYGSSQR